MNRSRLPNDTSVLSVVRSRNDARLPGVGGVLRREYEGKVYEVRVLKEGFSFQGRRYTSLSTIARDITGTIWNGFLFFGLAKYPAKAVKRDQKKKAS